MKKRYGSDALTAPRGPGRLRSRGDVVLFDGTPVYDAGYITVRKGSVMKSTTEAVGLALFLFAAAVLVGHCIGGCTPHEQNTVIRTGENAAAVVQYDQALAYCQEKARKLPPEQRFDGYIACEKAVSKHYCEESLELRGTWARCKEVMK